ncbi:MAG: hypothetical protein LUD68_01180 [Rikenellaceae bacterium]|nr:hypothetical protein [Rikenellaceae bacterium]
MKRFLILVFLAAGAGCSGRQPSTPEAEDIRLELARKDSLLNEVFASLNDISANLIEIKDREGLVTSTAAVDATREQQAQIFADIAAIDALLERNRASLVHLNDMTAQLRRSNVQVKELEILVAGFAKQIQDKDADLIELRRQLESMQIRIGELHELVDSLHGDARQLEASNRHLEETLAQQIDAANKVFYLIGRERELVQAEILDKSGFIGRTVSLHNRYNLEKFTATDRRTLDRILVEQRRARLVTPHPEGSYRLETGPNHLLKAVAITDPERFWESSKILVISYK